MDVIDDAEFLAQVHSRFPEGLTGVLALGGTRTSYILEQNRSSDKPGQIASFSDYVEFSLQRVLSILEMFVGLGGQNMIVALFSYQGFDERGGKYADLMMKYCLRLIDEDVQAYYRKNNMDPYFVGIDTLLHLPQHNPIYQFGARFEAFNKQWDYDDSRRKLIWEVAPIPLYSFWRAPSVMGEEETRRFEHAAESATNLQDLHDIMYRYYSKAAYGTELPIPHFYLGTNRNGDMKMRSMLPIAMLCGGPFRMFFTPYPSLFVTRDTLKAIIYDMMFGKRLRSTDTDYTDKLSEQIVEAEYRRTIELSADPLSTVGLVRSVGDDD